MLLPNALVIGAVFFSLAAATKKMLPVYIGSVLVLIGWLIAQQLVRDADNRVLAALIDPFGSRARQRPHRVLDDLRAQPAGWCRSRACCSGTGCSGSASARSSSPSASGASRSPRPPSPRRGKRSKVVADPADNAPAASDRPALAVRPAAATPPRPVAAWRLLPHRIWLEFRETTKNIYFGVLVLAGLLFLIFASTTVGDIYGTSTWPVTFQMLGLLSGSFAAFMLIIIAFYAGELVWRERDNRLDQISDALPMPTWLPLLSKLGALMLVPAVLQAVLMLCGMAIQAVEGLHPLRARALPVRHVHHRPGELLAGLRPGDRGARDRRQQVRRPLRRWSCTTCCCCSRASSASSTTSTSSAACRRRCTPT